MLDAMFGVTVKNAFRLYDCGVDKWYLLVTTSPTQRQKWMQAFDEERQRVASDSLNGFSIDSMKRPVFTQNSPFLFQNRRPVFTKTTKRVRVNRQKGTNTATTGDRSA